MSVEQETYSTGVDVPRPPRAPWANIIRVTFVLVALAVFIGLFYKQSFVVFSDRNAMDIAQIARNVAQGEGLSTHLIRPFNAGLPSMSETMFPFPEINHAPAYPWIVGQVFRLKGPSDQAVIWVSLVFLILTVIATAILGRILFDWNVAILAASMVGLSAYVLKVGMSGGEWTMIAFLFTLLLCAVTSHHAAIKSSSKWAGLVWVAICAVLFGLLYATNYILVFLIFPLAVYFGLAGKDKWARLGVFLALSVLFVAPLAVRNYDLTGSPILGVNAWDIMANTQVYPGDTFYRSANSGANNFIRTVLFPIEHFSAFAEKLVRGSVENTSSLIMMLGLLGLPFAVVSVLYKFKPQSANVIRGLIYGILPVVIVCLAIFSVDTKALVMLAPVIAVFGSAYLLLLLNAKKIHIIYLRTLVGAVVLITALPAIVAMAWGAKDVLSDHKVYADMFFAGVTGSGTIYTDVPWIAAWRTEGMAVWLPREDNDVVVLSARALPMQAVVLTPECDSYSSEEFWPVLHRVRIWRKYITDPQGAIKEIVDAAQVSSDKTPMAEKYVRRLKRRFALSDSLAGFTLRISDPLQPDDIQVLVKEGN